METAPPSRRPLQLEQGSVGDVLTFKVTGVMTLESFLDAVTPLLASDTYATSPRLWDFRGVYPILSSSDVFVMGQVVGERFKDTASLAAYVANPGVQFMKLESYRKVRSNDQHRRAVFTDFDDALAWLKDQQASQGA